MSWTRYGKDYGTYRDEKRCWNCKEEIHWGVFCLDCVRAGLVAFCSGLGAALVALWKRK